MNFADFIRNLWHQAYFGSILSIIACFCFYYLNNKNKPLNKIIWAIYCSVFGIAFFIFISKAIEVIYHPQVWDFTAFYLYGKVAVAGYDFYLPENFHTVYNTLHLPLLDYKEFVEEVVNSGFLYPPPTILLFSPLGFLSFHAALVCWTIFLLLFVPGCIYLIYDLFLKPYKLNGLLLTGVLFFLLSPVRSTIIFSQTNFILLFLLLLIIKYQDKKFAGILLAFALFTKPYMIVFLFFFILRKQWKTIIYFSISSIIFVGLTLLLFGKEPFLSYIFNNPSKRLPDWAFSEDINQSLHAVLLRFNLISLHTPAVYTYIIIGTLLPTGVYLFYLLKRKLYDYIWAVLLLVGLLLYPGTLTYYGVLLLFIIFQFFDVKKQLGFNMYLNIPIIGFFYYLSTVSVFSCICFLLIIIILKSLQPQSQTQILRYEV